MSQLLQDNGLPLSALWLQDHGEITTSQEPDLPLMPANLDDLPNWAYVGPVNVKNPGQGRQFFYKTVGTGRTPVKVVVYGTIRDAHLTALGNWSGKEKDASWASRLIELDGRSHPVAFEKQAAALQRLRQYAAISVRLHREEEAVQPLTHVRCQHRLFTMVRPGVVTPTSTLTMGDGPDNLAGDIADKWIVTAMIDMRKRGTAGILTPATALSFAVGDFVEVEATVDVIIRKSKNGSDVSPKLVETRLKPFRITKLLASSVPLLAVTHTGTAMVE